MKHFCALLLLILTAATAHAGATLKDARKSLLRGDYVEARELYEVAAKDPKSRVPAVIGISKAFESQGQYDKALDAIDGALKSTPKDGDLLGRRAELLYLRGKWVDAEEAAKAAIAAKEDCYRARRVVGQLL